MTAMRLSRQCHSNVVGRFKLVLNGTAGTLPTTGNVTAAAVDDVAITRARVEPGAVYTTWMGYPPP